MRPFFFLTCLSAILLPTIALAQDDAAATEQPDALITDRPDFTESSATVPAMRLQIEAGVQYTHSDLIDEAAPADHRGNYDANRLAGPNLLLRLGVSDFAELRLGIPDIDYESITGGGDDVGFGNLSVGAKFATALTDSLSIGVIPFVEVGVEADNFGGGLVAAASIDFTQAISLGVNAGVTTFEDNFDDRQYEGLGSAALGIGLSDEMGVFIETYALFPEGDFDLFVDTGVTYLATESIQLDAFMGTQVPDAEEIFTGMGISALF